MNNKDFNLLIVGYGAIGKLVSNISDANLKKNSHLYWKIKGSNR